MFETETVGPCLVQKLKWRGGGVGWGGRGEWPPCFPSPSGYAPVSFSCSGFHLLEIITDVSEADLSNLPLLSRVSQFL